VHKEASPPVHCLFLKWNWYK